MRFRDWRNGDRKATAKAGLRTAAEAAQVVAEIERARSQAQPKAYSPGQRMTLQELGEAYVREHVADGSIGPTHADNIRRTMAAVAKQGWTTPDEVTPAAFHAWRVKRGNVGHARHLVTVLRWSTILDQQVDPRLLERLPRKRREEVRDEPELLTREEVAAIMDRAAAYGPNVLALIRWLATYGWRPISALSLRACDLDLADRIVTCAHVKRGRGYRHPITPETATELRPLAAGRSGSDRIFTDPRTGDPWPTPDGKSYHFNSWYRHHIGRAAGLTGAKACPYVLKDYAITRMDAVGMPWSQISAITGTKSVPRYLKHNLHGLAEAMAGLSS
ncbi:MAG: hypothetical protein ACOCXA_07765 [Planctomycetota bacterium]